MHVYAPHFDSFYTTHDFCCTTLHQFVSVCCFILYTLHDAFVSVNCFILYSVVFRISPELYINSYSCICTHMHESSPRRIHTLCFKSSTMHMHVDLCTTLHFTRRMIPVAPHFISLFLCVVSYYICSAVFRISPELYIHISASARIYACIFPENNRYFVF